MNLLEHEHQFKGTDIFVFGLHALRSRYWLDMCRLHGFALGILAGHVALHGQFVHIM